MAKIDFYILNESSPLARLHFACRLIEKAYKMQHRIYVHTENQTDAHQLDEMLWTYRDDSFLPHNLFGEGPEPSPPIQIGIHATPTNHRDILMNLGLEVPACHTQFSRIIELIPSDTEQQEKGRARYRYYRAQGFEINTHKLQTIEN